LNSRGSGRIIYTYSTIRRRMMTRSVRVAGWVMLLALVFCCAIASADVIYLNTGGVVKGKIIERDTDSIIVVTEQGNRTEIFLSDIDRIEEGASVEEMYRDKAAKIKPGDADAHYKLGMWLKKVNYHEFAKEEFEKAVILDPDHEFARAELGYVKRKQGWILPKEESEEPWVHGIKKKARRTKVTRRKRLKFDRKLLEGLPEDLVNAADKLLDTKSKVRAEAYEAFDGTLRLLRGQTSKSLHDMQVKWFERWEKARLNALKIIYDRKIYPDENHGRAGQPKVNEAVNKVKKIWPYYDALVKAELSKLLRVSPKKAARMLDDYDLLLAQFREARAWLKKHNLETEEYQDIVTGVYRALLCHRAKRYNAGMAYARQLDDWEFRLYFRLMSLRILHYNDRIVKTSANVEERKLVQITNDYRMTMGRLPVEIDERLMKCCKKHSQEMNRLGYFSHTSPTKGRESPGKRAALEGYSGGVGENIYTGMGSAGAAFSAWFHSSGHHRNMLGGGDPQRMNGKAKGDRSQEGPNFSSGGWRTMGCGRDGSKFTEQFGPLSNLNKKEDRKK
jgi:hypothetical protein